MFNISVLQLSENAREFHSRPYHEIQVKGATFNSEHLITHYTNPNEPSKGLIVGTRRYVVKCPRYYLELNNGTAERSLELVFELTQKGTFILYLIAVFMHTTFTRHF